MSLADNDWSLVSGLTIAPQTTGNWLRTMLKRNHSSEYLRQFGAPTTIEAFRHRVRPCQYEDLAQYLGRLGAGEPNVLFAGRPVAYERTGGSSSGQKLIPYSQEGLLDFQRNILPWLGEILSRFKISGQAYFSISPALRKTEFVGQIPIGLTDAAYLGDHAAYALLRRSAVPQEVGELTDVPSWRKETLRYLAAARDLELISVWSPTFLLRLLDELPDPTQLWPRLKVVSCWASGPSKKFADELSDRLPQAILQPKGLLSTEAVVTIPDENSQPVLVEHGFVEFAADGKLLLAEDLTSGGTYEVVVTTASGLYRYRTGDYVRYEGTNRRGQPILEFLGRDSISCDIVGEKLTEVFVSSCLQFVPGYALLVPNYERPGYVLVCERSAAAILVDLVEERLAANPQYAYARNLGQLAQLKSLVCAGASSVVEERLLSCGTRLGDVKPLTLRSDAYWLALFEESSR